ncbi:MAG TPA: MFS transporter, partial [Candidatus Sumerlaeota bacterium]|nr:MFS transporter [Candidatus Sumerlaeota bacterium]
MAQNEIPLVKKRWTEGLTWYHWLVLAIACCGWMFDTMDQWLYVQAKTPALKELVQIVHQSDPAFTQVMVTKEADGWVGIAQTCLIIGWAVGGLFFGMVGDRLGRTRTMSVTILIYAAGTGLSGLAQSPIQFIILRFITGLGVGGEFAAGASLVAETFPAHARVMALSIVQAMSAVGNIMAGVIYYYVGANPEWGWRWVFAVGVIPAFLVGIIQFFIKEPEAWNKSKSAGEEMGNILRLFQERTLLRNTLIGVSLAAVGVVGFWGIGTWSAELIRGALNPQNLPELAKNVDQKMALCIMAQNAGGFLGVMLFSWVAQRFGRRPGFLISFVLCLIVIPVTFYCTHSFLTAIILFPLMGFSLLMI